MAVAHPKYPISSLPASLTVANPPFGHNQPPLAVLFWLWVIIILVFPLEMMILLARFECRSTFSMMDLNVDPPLSVMDLNVDPPHSVMDLKCRSTSFCDGFERRSTYFCDGFEC
ncbi:hypothetical protein F3Y22_tig00111650pilonHSYRG00006 [Hibiscus syriacus]|uniref:Transmembrane protein n=1 Tax=Hibiscus syriacus TaxID=106335 RepID=A0A6A2YC39_HIBSY|nr:hypothetical protein F3Y22_tig00111650pilonHSYRG00006 [Hibiscus syriacus]